MPELRVENLAKRYGKREVVKDVSLTLRGGEIIGLLGPNGAGKTTCFYMIAGLVTQDRGRILIDDRDISHYAMHQRARMGIGYLPQESSIFRKLSVADNLMAILETRRSLTRAQREEQMEFLLEEFHIAHLRDSPGIALSGGERRRAEIARALAVDPHFILLDEPFAGVDPVSVGDIKHIVEHLRGRGIGVLITDHNVRETLSLCDKAYIVGEGRIIAEGSTEQVLADATVRQVYLGEDFRL